MNNPDEQNTVQVVDHVVLPADQAESWLERWRAEYLPGARARGMSLTTLARRYAGRDTVAVHIAWDLPGIYPFYAMRAATAADPGIARFWAETDAVAVARDRHVLEPMEEK